MNWTKSFFKKFQKPHFDQIFRHQRAENEVKDTNLKKGQETHPLMVNARYVMNGTVSFLLKKIR